MTEQLCTDEYNLGKPCLETQVYGTFGKHSIKKICRYCLRMCGYGAHGAAAKPVTPVHEEFVSPNVSEHKSTIERLLTTDIPTDWEKQFLASVLSQQYMSAKQTGILGRILRKDSMPAKPVAQDDQYVPPPFPQQSTDLFDIPF